MQLPEPSEPPHPSVLRRGFPKFRKQFLVSPEKHRTENPGTMTFSGPCHSCLPQFPLAVAASRFAKGLVQLARTAPFLGRPYGILK